MEKNIAPRRIMKSESIAQVNDATVVLRHFIELSAKLLPFFNELSKKEMLMPQEEMNRSKIIEVFSSYKFDTSTSNILMNSTILETITELYKHIEKRVPGEESFADFLMEEFLNEHSALVSNWVRTDLN
jgi:hypothetical protein